MRIYIESTIPSYVVARPARDLLQAARQQLTKDWWDLQWGNHALFTSQIVLDEIADGEREMARLRLELREGISGVELSASAEVFAAEILQSGLLPASADGDAAHIALATVHKLDILLTWNCRQIANAAMVGRLRRRAESKHLAVTRQWDRSCWLDLFAQGLRRSAHWLAKPLPVRCRELRCASRRQSDPRRLGARRTPRLAQKSASQPLPSQLPGYL